MRKDFANIRRDAQNSFVCRVLFRSLVKSRISSPPWVSELIDLCGGKMAVKPARAFPVKNVASAHPDIILLAMGSHRKARCIQQKLWLCRFGKLVRPFAVNKSL